jgi:DNA-binding response OmpR family regulator
MTHVGPNVLMVDDDAAVRMALGQVLTATGYRVTTAATGGEAVAALSDTPFDVVVSDMRLPDVDGIEVLRVAMTQAFPPAVLLLTGYGTLDTAISALRLGASDYLLKPCSPQQLLKSVAEALTRRNQLPQPQSSLVALARDVADIQRQLQTIGTTVQTNKPDDGMLTIGRLQIGRLVHETRYAGQQLHLTPTEHTLLRCLTEAGDTVVLYSEIVRRTHGYTTSEIEAQALLKSHVRNLRRKIGEEIIVSVRNMGYRLLADPRPGQGQ